MRLILIRHAVAVDRAPGGRDADRPLTPRGAKRFRLAAAGLSRAVARPARLLTSPLLRARQTAEIAAAAWGRIEPELEPTLAGGPAAPVLERLRAVDAPRVALVGHEPQLSELLAALLRSSPAAVAFRKGGVAVVDLPEGPGGPAELYAALPPKALRRLAR